MKERREEGKEGKKKRRGRGKGKKFVASLEMGNGSREETFSVVSNRPNRPKPLKKSSASIA